MLLKRSSLNCRKTRRWGVAALEFAVVAPVFLGIVFASIEFGRAVMVANGLTNAAREGARYGALTQKGSSNLNTDIITEVKKHLTNASIPNTNATIKIYVDDVEKDAKNATNHETIKVTVSVLASDVTWLPTKLMKNSGGSLSGAASMRSE